MDGRLTELYVQRLGFKPLWLHALADPSPGSRPWRVGSVERGTCTLLGLDDAGGLVEAQARRQTQELVVGDWVLVGEHDASARIEHVFERVTWLRRGSAHGDHAARWIAANLDVVFVVVAFAATEKLERRLLRARRLDRFISGVREGGATPVVLLNKVDLAGRVEHELTSLGGELSTRLGGTEVVCVSALAQRGLAALSAWLMPGATVAFVGPSGVGKSSLINALLGREVQRVGDVRERDSKGRHTTTRRQLLTLECGAFVIDTPGVREFAVIAEERVAGFDDIEVLARDCRFSDCTHAEEPDCAVTAAVERGDLPGDRLESYRDLERDAQRARSRHDGYARGLQHAEQRRFGRMAKRAVAEKRQQERE